MIATLLAIGADALADEGGVSFWLPGQYASYAAAPATPGLSFETLYYHGAGSASTARDFQRGGGVVAGVKSPADLVMLTPTYTFATPLFGAQVALGATAVFGRNTTSAYAVITGPGGGALGASRADEVTGVGDIYPFGTLKWSRGDHNWMLYAMTGVPVGAYDVNRMSALGLGRWAADAGAGYTYANEKSGIEWSAVLGFTYNFMNPHTKYQSGVDAHLDWGASFSATDKLTLGVVGYVYNQITGDSGPGATRGDFRSRVAAVGPQIAYAVSLGERPGSLSLRAYREFGAVNRLEGWSAYLSVIVEAKEPPSSALPRRVLR